MSILRYQQDVFGQSMLVGINWEWLWLPVVAALAVVVVQVVLRLMRGVG